MKDVAQPTRATKLKDAQDSTIHLTSSCVAASEVAQPSTLPVFDLSPHLRVLS